MVDGDGDATITIERLGADGDGIAVAGGARLFVPFTVPGDRVRVVAGPARGGGREARVVERLSDGPGRAGPVCPHFGTCGGCATQHLDEATYLAWKHGVVAQALARRGLGGVVVEPVVVAHGPRRRVNFALGRDRGRPTAGFRPRFGTPRFGKPRFGIAVVDVTVCPVIDDRLFALLGPLRALAGDVPALGAATQALATVTPTGIDLVLEAPARLGAEILARLATFAERHGLARLSLRTQAAAATVVERTAPTLTIAGVAVVLPPGGFVQATEAGEAAIGARVTAAASGARRVADLYA
ncbi:MAG: class I SAM-dependent RNA methyltransferase, partial [Alphaproteobacteria bacterium]